MTSLPSKSSKSWSEDWVIFVIFYLLSVWVWGGWAGMRTVVCRWGQRTACQSQFSPTMKIRGSNSSPQAWQRVPLPTEPSHLPEIDILCVCHLWLDTPGFLKVGVIMDSRTGPFAHTEHAEDSMFSLTSEVECLSTKPCHLKDMSYYVFLQKLDNTVFYPCICSTNVLGILM